MKKIVLAIAFIVFAAIGITYHHTTNTETPIAIWYDPDNMDRCYDYMWFTTPLEAIDDQDSDGQNTEPQTCDSENLTCVIEMSVNKRFLTAEACEFNNNVSTNSLNPMNPFGTGQAWAMGIGLGRQIRQD